MVLVSSVRLSLYVHSRCIDAESGAFIEAEGTVDGIITDRVHGSGGFGYDPLFWLPELERGMAELTKEEKGRISHRGNALIKLLPLIGHSL